MTWDWQYVWRVLPVLLEGLRTTLLATLLAFSLAAVLGLGWAIARHSGPPPLTAVATLLAQFIRGTPLLVQLFFLFYVLPFYGLMLSPLLTGVLGLGVHFASYLSEVYRAGIASVPRGQWEAAYALSYPRWWIWSRVVLPQAVPAILPGLGNYLISMFKDSATLSAITVTDLLFAARDASGQSFRYLEPLTLAGVLFFAISYPASLAVRLLHRRLAVHQ
jgi:polar amino acid transport system permease protein